MRRLFVALEVGRRADDHEPLIDADANGDHFAIEGLAEANACIKALRNDIPYGCVVRATRRTPTRSSSARPVGLTADGVTRSSAAAAVKLFFCATHRSARNPGRSSRIC